MCGVFGFITKDGRGPSMKTLAEIALWTETRGKHAFGLAWVDRKGVLHSWKRPGAVSANLGDLERVKDAVAVIGHCRWATHGSPLENKNNHPHKAGKGFIVHNGVVHNHKQIEEDFRLQLETVCDSEVLGKLIAHFPGPLDARGAKAAEEAQGPLVILGLWTNPVRLLLVRNGNPLSYGEVKRGTYFGSLNNGLPGIVRSCPDEYADVIEYNPN